MFYLALKLSAEMNTKSITNSVTVFCQVPRKQSLLTPNAIWEGSCVLSHDGH